MFGLALGAELASRQSSQWWESILMHCKYGDSRESFRNESERVREAY
jgi:hypothetical protein